MQTSNDFIVEWEEFRTQITYHTRFFDEDSLNKLHKLFKRIHTLKGAIQAMTGQEKIYRARLVQGERKISKFSSNPWGELGVPPRKKRQANRLNPSGIKCFYGSLYSRRTAVAELRPAINEQAVVGQFYTNRSMFVLDTTYFKSRPNYNSTKTGLAKKKLHIFMRQFMNDISKPTNPGDEHIEYIPSQVIAEYFMNHYRYKSGNNKKRLEGIIYFSSQAPTGKNIALFGTAAMNRVSALEEINTAAKDGDTKFRNIDKDAYIEESGLEYKLKSVRLITVGGIKYDQNLSTPNNYE
jgi:hypothetical protein